LNQTNFRTADLIDENKVFSNQLRKMNIQTTLKQIDDALNGYMEANWTVITGALLEEIQIERPYDIYRFPHSLVNSFGVYSFHIKTSIDIPEHKDLEGLWLTDSSGKRLYSGKPIKQRFKFVKKDVWTCLYVGKSENLEGRIMQHIHQATKYTTYGLKLSHHDRLHHISEFAYSFFEVAKTPITNVYAMKALLTALESKARNELMPLIGKQ
jgi:hypothetical protein